MESELRFSSPPRHWFGGPSPLKVLHHESEPGHVPGGRACPGEGRLENLAIVHPVAAEIGRGRCRPQDGGQSGPRPGAGVALRIFCCRSAGNGECPAHQEPAVAQEQCARVSRAPEVACLSIPPNTHRSRSLLPKWNWRRTAVRSGVGVELYRYYH